MAMRIVQRRYQQNEVGGRDFQPLLSNLTVIDLVAACQTRHGGQHSVQRWRGSDRTKQISFISRGASMRMQISHMHVCTDGVPCMACSKLIHASLYFPST